jgi:hypothetical protein
MTRKESHGNRHRGSSPEGCWKLAGDDIPGQCIIMTLRPGGAPEECKVSQGMEAQSRLDLDYGISTLCLCLPIVAWVYWPAGAARKPTKNRLNLNQIKPKNNPNPIYFNFYDGENPAWETHPRSRVLLSGRWRCHPSRTVAHHCQPFSGKNFLKNQAFMQNSREK